MPVILTEMYGDHDAATEILNNSILLREEAKAATDMVEHIATKVTHKGGYLAISRSVNVEESKENKYYPLAEGKNHDRNGCRGAPVKRE